MTTDPKGPRTVPPLMVAAWETATSTESDPLTALGATRALAALLSTWESKLVAEAVADGATWEAVGGTVGVSRQAAWERFHGDVHELRDQMRALRERHRQETNAFRERLRNEVRHRPH